MAEPVVLGWDFGNSVPTRYWRLGDGYYHRIPDYLPDAWLDRIQPEFDGERWHYLWTGWNNGEGHAKVRRAGAAIYCHRDVVERVEGRKLTRFQYVDHRCERKPCLNYDCLEAVSPGVNTQRGPGAQHQYKTADAYAASESSPATYGDPLDAL